MRHDFPALVPLVCPRCRTRTAASRDMHTLALARAWREQGDEVLDGELACENPACSARYPIVDGVALVASDVAALCASQAVALLGNRPAETLAALAGLGPDDAALPRLLDHLSVYTDAHFGDRAEPPPDGPAVFGFAPFAERLAALPGHARRTVELGCSVGRGLLSLAAGSDLVVGVDLHLGALRAARTLTSGEALAYPRRVLGRHYRTAGIAAAAAATANVGVVCGDALDPPLPPAHFDRVVALNLLDSVRTPGQLLSVVDGLLESGGELVLSCPYSFQSQFVDDAARPSAEDPAAWLVDTLRSGRDLEARYEIVDEAELDWVLRRDARSTQSYRSHYLRARKLGR